MRHAFAILFLLLTFVDQGFSQVSRSVVEGQGIPTDSVNGDWYLDTVAQEAFFRQEKMWVKVKVDWRVTSLKACSNMILLQQKLEGRVYTPQGRMFERGVGCECHDQIIRIARPRTDEFYRDSTYLGCVQDPNNEPYTMSPVILDTVQGIPAFCVTSAPANRFHTIPIHGWGMIGTNGQWLIQPIYDQSFGFRNGLAEVLYYAVKHKINEKGEFVE